MIYEVFHYIMICYYNEMIAKLCVHLFFNKIILKLHVHLQVIHRFWERNDVKGAIAALEKMSDHAVCILLLKLLL